MSSLCLTSDVGSQSKSVSQQTIRVLHVINGEYYAGAERVQDLLALNLPSFDCQAGFACVKPDQFSAMRQCRDVPLDAVPSKHPWDRQAIRQIADLVQDGQYDLLHSHTPRSAWAALAAGRITGRPVVHTMHDMFLAHADNLARQLFNLYTIHRLRAADYVTTVSPETLQLAERLHLGKSRSMIRNGVPVAADFHEREQPTEWVLGTVCLIRPCKGIEVLVRAMARLRDRDRPVKAVVVGTFYTPEYEQEIRALIESLGVGESVQLAGFSNDVPAFLRTFDLFALPSVGPEGLPMVLLEAMAHGLPTIGSNVPGVGDVLRDQVDGRIVPPRNDLALADAIDEFLLGRANWPAMRREVVQRHQAEFSAQRMAREMAEIYRSVV